MGSLLIPARLTAKMIVSFHEKESWPSLFPRLTVSDFSKNGIHRAITALKRILCRVTQLPNGRTCAFSELFVEPIDTAQ